MSSEVDRMGSDDWVARVWTYQGILNSPGMRFIAEGAHVSLSAMEVLSGVGQFMVERERALGIDAFALKKLHPRLDALQEVLAEWQVGSYLERPVFQLLSGMGTRDSTHPDDRYNAIIGIVTQASGGRTSNGAPLHAVETLLNACDAKGDFSYVYAVAPRCAALGRSWRPVAKGPLRAPMLWHCYGTGQGAR